jgi:DNA gyrase subunit A
VRGQSTREGDGLRDHLVADNHDVLLFFTNRGRVYTTKVFRLPAETSRNTRGAPLVQYLQLKPGESVQTMVTVASLLEEKNLLFATRLGEIKRMALSNLANIRTNGLNAMDLELGDELIAVRLAFDQDDVIMVSRQGLSIRFPVLQIRSSSRAAGGVRGMKLRNDDSLVAMDVVIPDTQLLVISERGYGKPTSLDRYRPQSRGGVGLTTFRITSKSGPVAAASIVKEGEDILILSQRGQETRTNLTELRQLSRRTQGVTIVSLSEGDAVVSIASMEPRVRTDRDTIPRLASGNVAPRVELQVEEPSTNGHKEGEDP